MHSNAKPSNIQFSKLERAIANNNIAEVKRLLQSFSLLHPDFFVDRAHLAKTKEYIHIDSPEIIYAILAAGYPVIDLLSDLIRLKLFRGQLALLKMLPHLDNSMVESLENMPRIKNELNDKYNNLDKCALSATTPNFPIKIDGMLYDLLAFEKAFKTHNTFSTGWNMKSAITVVDHMIFNMEYIQMARALAGNNFTDDNFISDLTI